MKQRILAILLSLTMMFTLVPTAMAEGGTAVAKVGDVEYETLQAAVKAATTENSTVTLLKDVTEDITIPTGVTAMLDLSGKTLTNKAGKHTITVENGGKLNISDSVGTGVVDNTSHGKAAIYNKGEVTLNGGTFTRSQENGISKTENGGNSFYTLLNHGAMTIKESAIVNQGADGKGKFSSLVENGYYSYDIGKNDGSDAPTLIVSGGMLYGGLNTIKNDEGGVLEITGGEIKNSAQACVLNWNKAIITAGTFTLSSGVATVMVGKYSDQAVGDTKISGGTFTAPKDIPMIAHMSVNGTDYGVDTSTSITGGTFSGDVAAYIPSDYIQGTDGTVAQLGETNAVAKVGDTYYKTLADAVTAAKNGETVTLLKNAEMTETIRITDGKKITLALDGHDVVIKTNGKFFLVCNGELTVTGTGMIKEETPYFAPIIIKGGAEKSENYSVVNVEEGVILEGWAGVMIDQTINTTNNYGMVLNVNGATLKGVKDTDNAEGLGVYVNGVVADAKVTLNNATLTADGYGMYLAGNADTTITGGTVSGTTTGIEIRAGKLTLDNCDVTGGSGEVTKNANGNGSTVNNAALAISQHTTKKDIDVTINGGTYTGTAAVYQTDVQGTGSENVKVNVNNGKFNGTVVGETANKLSITGGYFTSDPTAYLAASHYVWASDKDGYTYMVKNTAPTSADQKITVVDKTDTAVSSDITGDDKTAINNVISKANVDGVAEAVAPAKKADIVAKSSATVAENDKVEIEVAVKVEAKAADLANGKLTFEASPVATVKVNGTATSTTVPVTNDMLNGNAITVKLPLPTGFNPEQIKHISSDGSVEYFLKTAKRGANTFEIKDGCAVFTITKFSTFELSGTVTYVEPSYYSGSSSDPTYSVTVDKTENGSVTVSPKSASKGSTVTITVKPDSGYVLETLTVTDKNGDELKLTDKGNGKYTFTMPGSKVEVKATFMEDNSVLNFFYDVPNGAYFYEAVKWAVDKGITNGLSDTMFGPYESCTRAQIVTFLWRAAGSPEPKAASSFTDVPANAYYAKAVAWAVENGITNGMTATMFAPDATCTRGQSVTFLYRALKGTASGSANFTDVKSDAFYADAINWAVANNVTNGTSNTTFSPNADCTRAEIVTFLYRAYQGK